MRVVATVERLVNGLSAVLFALASLVGAFVVVATLVLVGLRYWLNITPTQLFELVEFAMLFMAFLAVGYVARDGGHIQVEIIGAREGTLAHHVTEIASGLVVVLVCGALAYGAGVFTLDSLESGVSVPTRLAPPRWAIMWIVPVGFAMVALHQALALLRQLTGGRSTAAETSA